MREFERQLPDGAPFSVRNGLANLHSSIEEEQRRRWRVPPAEGRLLRLIRSLPTCLESLTDGGPETARRLLEQLGSDIPSDIRSLLETAEQAQTAEQFSQAVEPVRRARDQLLDLVSTDRLPEIDWREQVFAEFQAALSWAESGLDREDLRVLVAHELADELEEDPLAASNALLQLAEVMAATNQKIISRQASVEIGEDIWFDTVIVDEAAHANPLDLLIPMSLATRRVILVGDHRQLPALLEPEIQQEVECNIADEMKGALDHSLFERLINHVRTQDANGDTRREVTLDTQFRMHPRLGDFVSEAFYEQDGGLHSPEDPTPYIHTDAQLLGKTCVWIDVPASRGREEGTRSKYRTAEAEATADLVARWVALPSQPSVGAMSLYGAQTDQVLAALEVAGLARSSPEGVVVTEGRVRVGNVDAFQGREFDHVALSLARSNSNTHPVGAFGLLTLVNRLCVAMSRQRKLLVLVGDFEMFSSDLAKSSVPAIWKFAQICREDNAVQR